MKVPVRNYTFNASAKTIRFDDYSTIKIENVLLITDVSAGTTNRIIYNFAIPGLGGTVSGNVLTLEYNTASMTNNDPLMIYYDDDQTNAATDEMISLLKLIRKQMESNAVVDRNFRQRITLDAIQLAAAGTTTELAGTLPVSSAGLGTSLAGVTAVAVAPPYSAASTIIHQNVWEGPVDQRWRVMEDSRLAYQSGIKNKLSFS